MAIKPSKKILLVDDERFALEIMKKALTNEGFYCLIASSAKDALEILKTEVPDLILSDYEMPDMNGFDFRQQVLTDTAVKDIPFVFLTAFTDEDLMIKGLDLNAIDYIDKTTPTPVIVSKLNNLLSAVKEQHERSIQELRTAAEALNLRSVPSTIPVIPGFKVDFWHKTFQNYPGGDFIDFIQVDDEYTFIVLGDVMGKKWGAWFFSFNFLSYIRSAVRLCVFDGDLSTSSILQKINNVICHDPVLSDVLSTLSLLMVNHKSGDILYTGAGDLPLVSYSAETKSISKIESTGLLMGLFADGQYNERTIKMVKGDKLLIISDGMIDFEDSEGKKSDYNLFTDSINGLLDRPDSFNLIKNVTFLKEKSKDQIDDCSLIFIEK